MDRGASLLEGIWVGVLDGQKVCALPTGSGLSTWQAHGFAST